MRICHLIYDDVDNPWLGGGGAVRARQIYRRLAPRHEITLISGAYPGSASDEVIDGIRHLRVGGARSYASSRLSYCRRALDCLRSQQWDVWVHEFSAFAPLWPSRAMRRRGVLFFYHFVGRHALRKHPVVGSLAWAAETMTLHAYQRVVTISPSVQQQVRGKLGGAAAIDCLYTGVDDGYFQLNSVEEDSEPYMLYFGRLDVHTKGIDLLLSAFARITTEFPRLRLILAGRSAADQRARAQSLIAAAGLENQVILHGDGAVSEADKGELLRRCLFLCMPSRYEGWGIVAVEAAAAGKAVLATRIPGLVDAVQEGETGLLVPSGDEAGLAEGMRQLLTQPELRRRLGNAGRGWAKRFDWDTIARSQEELLQRAAQGNSTEPGTNHGQESKTSA